MSALWILDRLQPEWEDHQLREALVEQDLSAAIIDWETVSVDGDLGTIRLAGEPTPTPAVALVRSRVLTRHSEGELALLYDALSQLEDMGVHLVNSASSIRRSQNKVWQAALLRAEGVPVPRTRTVRTVKEVGSCLHEWGEVVLKPIYGHASVDLVRLQRGGELPEPDSLLGVREEIVAWHLLKRYHSLCAQEYVDNLRRDLRVLVIGTDVVSCHYRISTSPTGEVKSLANPYRREPAAITPELERVTQAAVSCLGLDAATLDYVESSKGPVLIEVNPTVSVWQPLEGTELDLTPSGITARHARLLAELASECRVGP